MQHLVQNNSFGFAVRTEPWKFGREGLEQPNNQPSPAVFEGLGIWTKAVKVGHSCLSNTRHSFIGDVMIWRAERDIPKDNKLTIQYNSWQEEYGCRHVCPCPVCKLRKRISIPEFDRRRGILVHGLNHTIATSGDRIWPDKYKERILAIQDTYILPPSEIPRTALVKPLIGIIRICKTICSTRSIRCLLEFGLLLFYNLGFTARIDPYSWNIDFWGLACEEVIEALKLMKWVCDAVHPRLCKGLIRDTMTMHTIFYGQDGTYDGDRRGHYDETPGGSLPLQETKDGKLHEIDVPGLWLDYQWSIVLPEDMRNRLVLRRLEEVKKRAG